MTGGDARDSKLKRIQLSTHDMDLLETRILSEHPEFAACLKRSDRTLVLTELQHDQLMDAMTDRLQRVGFAADWEPTQEGLALEDLIDRIASQS